MHTWHTALWLYWPVRGGGLKKKKVQKLQSVYTVATETLTWDVEIKHFQHRKWLSGSVNRWLPGTGGIKKKKCWTSFPPGTKQKSAKWRVRGRERYSMRLLKQATPNGWLISAPETFTRVEQGEKSCHLATRTYMWLPHELGGKANNEQGNKNILLLTTSFNCDQRINYSVLVSLCWGRVCVCACVCVCGSEHDTDRYIWDVTLISNQPFQCWD